MNIIQLSISNGNELINLWVRLNIYVWVYNKRNFRALLWRRCFNNWIENFFFTDGGKKFGLQNFGKKKKKTTRLKILNFIYRRSQRVKQPRKRYIKSRRSVEKFMHPPFSQFFPSFENIHNRVCDNISLG